MKNSGFFWHVHHEVLLEWCYDYNERAKFIRTKKAKEEQKLRLRLLQPVKGDLPQEVVETGRAYNEARRAHDEAERVYYEARRAYNKAERAYNEARQAYIEALKKNKSAIETLHAAECLNCPWDGHTIFPNT